MLWVKILITLPESQQGDEQHCFSECSECSPEHESICLQPCPTSTKWYNHFLTSSLTSFFFFPISRQTVRVGFFLCRQVTVKECKDLNSQLFPVSSWCKVRSSLSLKPGLVLDWTLPGVRKLRAFHGLLVAMSKFLLIPWAEEEMGKWDVVVLLNLRTGEQQFSTLMLLKDSATYTHAAAQLFKELVPVLVSSGVCQLAVRNQINAYWWVEWGTQIANLCLTWEPCRRQDILLSKWPFKAFPSVGLSWWRLELFLCPGQCHATYTFWKGYCACKKQTAGIQGHSSTTVFRRWRTRVGCRKGTKATGHLKSWLAVAWLGLASKRWSWSQEVT